jgi:Skp family chaperone for outer membrane proteins
VQDRLRVELNAIVVALAKERGAAYVLNQDAIILAPSAADWTDEVLKRLNATAAERKKP